MEIEKVMDRKVLADTLHGILKAGTEMLLKDELDKDDHARIKVIRNMGPALSASVTMVQQETAQQRMAVIVERMKQLGYDEPKALR